MRISSAVCVVSAAELEKKKIPKPVDCFWARWIIQYIWGGLPRPEVSGFNWLRCAQMSWLMKDTQVPSMCNHSHMISETLNIAHSGSAASERVCVCVEWNGVVWSGGTTRDFRAQTLHTEACHVWRWAKLSQCLSLALFFNQCSRVPCVPLSGLTTAAVFRFSPTVVAAASADFYALKSTLIPIFTSILHSLSCTQTSNAMSNCLLWSVDSESCRSCISGSE